MLARVLSWQTSTSLWTTLPPVFHHTLRGIQIQIIARVPHCWGIPPADKLPTSPGLASEPAITSATGRPHSGSVGPFCTPVGWFPLVAALVAPLVAPLLNGCSFSSNALSDLSFSISSLQFKVSDAVADPMISRQHSPILTRVAFLPPEILEYDIEATGEQRSEDWTKPVDPKVSWEAVIYDRWPE